MHATASFPAVARVASSSATRPVVFIGNLPEPSLCVRRITWSAPLNEVDAQLDVAGPVNGATSFHRQTAIVATPRLLRDGQTRWDVHAVGRLEQPRHTDNPTEHLRRLIVQDQWTATLSRPQQNLEAADRDPRLLLPPSPTVGQALQALSDHYRVDLGFRNLPRLQRDEPLLGPLRLDTTLRGVLEPLLEAHKFFIQRDLILTADHVAQTLSVRPLEYGRRIRLPFSRPGQSASPIVALDIQNQTPRARQWIARGGRPRVESTFMLTPGWDATLEGQPDTDYDHRQSTDFSRFGNVYRRWILNEDATQDAPVLDLAALFGQPALPPTALPFGRCLTLDDAGQSLPPIIEISTDAGVAWSRLTEPATLLHDRAGVVLDSITLPPAVLAAAKNSDLRVRITATLASPLPLSVQRWQGNPFADVGPDVILNASARFTVNRLLPGSLHDAAVRSGELAADLRDDTQPLADWLMHQLDRDTQAAAQSTAQARLTLANARPEIRVGDRLDETQPGRRDIRGNPTSLHPRAASVTQVRCDFEQPIQTVLTLLA